MVSFESINKAIDCFQLIANGFNDFEFNCLKYIKMFYNFAPFLFFLCMLITHY